MNRNFFLKSLLPISMGSMFFGKAFAMPLKPLNHNKKMPPFLRVGDTIGITASASPMDLDGLKNCLDTLQKWGLKAKLGNTIGKHWLHFGGTDEERTADLQHMLDDDTIDAILFARGGYGCMRMMDNLNWEKFAKKPKWLVGYSDITALHCHLQTVYGIPTIHADMGNGFGLLEDDASTSLKDTLMGKKNSYQATDFRLNRAGKANGILIGGNLSLQVAVQGSKSALKTAGKILVIEDVSEYKYSIDRMLMNLKRSGSLDNLAGLVVGGFTDIKIDAKGDDFPMPVEEIVFDKIKNYNYPVAFHFPVGHQKQNMALKLGCYYTLEVNEKGSHLFEPKLDKNLPEVNLNDDAKKADTLYKIIPDSNFVKPIIDTLK